MHTDAAVGAVGMDVDTATTQGQGGEQRAAKRARSASRSHSRAPSKTPQVGEEGGRRYGLLGWSVD